MAEISVNTSGAAVEALAGPSGASVGTTRGRVWEALQGLFRESPGRVPGYEATGRRARLATSTARKWTRRFFREGLLPSWYELPSLQAKKSGLHGDTEAEIALIRGTIEEIRQTKQAQEPLRWEVPEVRVAAALRGYRE